MRENSLHNIKNGSVAIGMFNAIKKVPEWHAEMFLNIYDKLYTSKLTGLEREVADAMRPKIEKQAKVMGWVATGLEATAITIVASKGYTCIRDRLRGQNGDLNHAFFSSKDNRIHEVGGMVAECIPVDDLHVPSGEPLPAFLHRLSQDSSHQVGQGRVTVLEDADHSLVGILMERRPDGKHEYLVNFIPGRKKEAFAVHVLEGSDGKQYGYAFKDQPTWTKRKWLREGIMAMTDRLKISSSERSAFHPVPLTSGLLARIESVVTGAMQRIEPTPVLLPNKKAVIHL